ncbi:MAG: hypothetical protein U0U70_05450 [Chitinophagaceae bacterium]
MRKLLLLLVMLPALHNTALCQGGGKEDKASFWDKIEIKKSFDSKLDKTKPALASFTLPAGEKNYFTINGGIAYRISKLETGKTPSKAKLDIFAVYNRNNQLNKEQHNYKGGLSLEKVYVFGNSANPGTTRDGFARDLPVLWGSFSNEYIRNRVDSTGSFASLLYLTPGLSLGKKIKIGKPVLSVVRQEDGKFDPEKSGRVSGIFSLSPGLEYQNTFTAPSSGTKGSLTRFCFSATYNWSLRWREKAGDPSAKWISLVDVTAGYTYRNDFYNSTVKKEGYLPLYQFGIAFYPFRKENIAAGIDYQKGSDPVNGIDDQEFWQFTLKFKKDLK